LFCLLSVCNSYGDNTIDSLKKVLKTNQADTAKAKTLNTLIIDLITLGNYPQADSLIQEELTISGKIAFKQGIANAVLAKGIVDYYQGLYSEALICLYDSHKKFDTIDDQHGIASSILYIGYVYEGQSEYKKALDKFNESSLLFAALKDDDYNATAIIHIGNIYNNLLINYDKAKENYLKSLSLFTKAGDEDGIASVYEDMGVMYYHQKQYDTSLFYQKKAFDLFEKLNDREGLSKSVVYLGNIYFDLKNYTQAIECADKSLALAKAIGSFADIKDAEYLSSEAYLGNGNAMQALEHYKNFVAAKDSIISQENTKKSIEAEISFEFARKQAIVQAEQDKKDAEQKLEARKQQIIIYFISGILLLILGVAIFAYRSYLQKQRDNKELDIRNKKIEAAYSIIEEKNREITDSINYARRIQHAILPEKQTIEKAFPQSFVLFKPKDIVSGDFYWMYKGDGSTLIAAADCTGHGVPGGFMSMIGSEKLNDAAQQSPDTGKILSLLNKGIKKSLHQSEEQESTRDGMDIALCSVQAHPPPEGGNEEGYGYEMADPILYGLLKDFVKKHRSVPTEAENAFWQLVRAKSLEGYKFRRQHIIGNYIADFVCLSHRLIIEIDGPIHELPDNKLSDEQRTAYLKTKGFNVLRFKNNEVIGNSEFVLSTVLNELKKSQRQIPPSGGGGAVLTFSGANRPLWIIRKGATEIEEIKPDKMAIGGFTEGEQNFNTNTLQLHKGDSFYIFSDGYADQFGGPQGKKLSTKKFRDILLSIQNLSMTEQSKYLEKSMADWKGNREQLDDILVIGIRL